MGGVSTAVDDELTRALRRRAARFMGSSCPEAGTDELRVVSRSSRRRASAMVALVLMEVVGVLEVECLRSPPT